MDEPFGAVDPIVRKELQAETLRLQRDLDKTVVFVTHDIDEAFLLGDQVVILERGAKIAQVGTPASVTALLQSPGSASGRPSKRLLISPPTLRRRADTPPSSPEARAGCGATGTMGP